jgi:hypothetical protein
MTLELFHSRLAVADWIPALVLVLSLLAAWKRPFAFGGPFAAFERFTFRIGQNKAVAVLTLALLPILLRLCLSWLVPVPVPGIHDEFSYLLAADTFAQGRLTNPPHTMWVFFETIHVNQLPTYMSKYPPAQGAVLAVGQVLGHPWVGVLISVSVMCVAIFWMLQGWLPQRWAFLGASFVALRLGAFSYWVNSYWGGAIPAIGGALVLGAVPRVMRLYRVRDVVFLAVGLSILANSRPLEGFILCSSVALSLTVVFRRKAPASLRRFASRVASFPVIATLLSTALFMGFYNWRGTHNALIFPYVVNDQTYGNAPHFVWQHAMAPRHSVNPQLEGLYAWERQYWSEHRMDSAKHLARHFAFVVVKFAYFFLWPQFFFPFALAFFLVRDIKIRFFLLQFLICFLGMVAVVWSQPHYAAPLTATIFFLVTQALRYIRLWRYRGQPVGLALSRVLVAFTFAMTFVYIAEATRNPSLASFVAPAGVWANPGNQSRAEILKQLEAISGKHLVIVRYSTGNADTGEWVYNRADIDNARIVWAREIPGVDTEPLLNYFSSYNVWLLEPRFSPPRLTPFHKDR